MLNVFLSLALQEMLRRIWCFLQVLWRNFHVAVTQNTSGWHWILGQPWWLAAVGQTKLTDRVLFLVWIAGHLRHHTSYLWTHRISITRSRPHSQRCSWCFRATIHTIQWENKQTFLAWSRFAQSTSQASSVGQKPWRFVQCFHNQLVLFPWTNARVRCRSTIKCYQSKLYYSDGLFPISLSIEFGWYCGGVPVSLSSLLQLPCDQAGFQILWILLCTVATRQTLSQCGRRLGFTDQSGWMFDSWTMFQAVGRGCECNQCGTNHLARSTFRSGHTLARAHLLLHLESFGILYQNDEIKRIDDRLEGWRPLGERWQWWTPAMPVWYSVTTINIGMGWW